MDPESPTDQDETSTESGEAQSHDEAFADAVAAGLRGEELPEADKEEGGDDEPTEAARGDEEPAKEVAAGDGKAKAPEEVAAATEELDVDAPLDEGVDERTRARFDKMRETYKEASEERDEARSQLDELRSVIAETQTSPDDFAQTIDLLADRNSGDPDRMNRAFDTLMGEVQRLGKALGRPVSLGDEGGLDDALEDFPDLREMVTNLDITEAAAVELAQGRRAQQIREAAANRSAEAEQQTNQVQAAIQAGASDVDALMDHYRTNDPDFQTKQGLLTDDLKTIAATVPPDQWVTHIEREWSRVTRILAAAGTSGAAAPRTAQPLPGGASRSGAGAPASFAGAIAQGLRGDQS